MKKAKIIKGYKPRANDKYDNFDDEQTLAELIQNAAARGLTSTRGSFFANDEGEGLEAMARRKNIYDTGYYLHSLDEDDSVNKKARRLKKPPEGATCACALGAQMLSPRLTKPLESVTVTVRSNDIGDDTDMPPFDVEVYADKRSADIGAAYEQALRPD